MEPLNLVVTICDRCNYILSHIRQRNILRRITVFETAALRGPTIVLAHSKIFNLNSRSRWFLKKKNDLKESFWNWIEVSSSFQTYLQPHSPVSTKTSKLLSKLSLVKTYFFCFNTCVVLLVFLCLNSCKPFIGTFQGKSGLAPYVKCFATSREI